MLMIQVYLPSGGYVDDVINNQTNLHFTSIIVEHFMIAQECVRLSEELFLMCTSV